MNSPAPANGKPDATEPNSLYGELRELRREVGDLKSTIECKDRALVALLMPALVEIADIAQRVKTIEKEVTPPPASSLLLTLGVPEPQ